MQDSVEVSLAPCGCRSVIYHLPTCALVHGKAAVAAPRCDTEDGRIWLHQGTPSRPYTPAELDDLFALLASCKEAAEQQHAEGHR